MRPLPNIRRAGAGRQPRVRLIGFTVMAILAMAPSFVAPLAAQASLASDIKGLPDDTSPRQACGVLIKNGEIKASQEGKCREIIAEGFAAAKPVSPSGSVTIASAAACAIQVFHKKLKQSDMAKCSKQVAESAPDPGGGGGGFDPLGSATDFVGGAVDTITGAIGGAVTGTILDGFKAIIGLLFGGLQSAITVALIKWITTVPNLSGGHVGDLEASIAVGAGGLLAATMTISIVRFWGSGLTGDGAWAGAEGVARAAAAAALIGLWPRIFDLAIRLSNALQAGILGGAVQAQLKALFRDLDVIGISTGALTAGVVPMFLMIVIAIVGILMLLALVAMKIVITALTVVLFCAMPLALVVWPIPELAGIARFCIRSLAVVIAIPVVWCIIFGAFAAIGASTFSFSGTGKDEGIFGTALNVTIVRPLVGIALLYLALVTPRRLLQMAPFTGGGGRGMARTIATGAALRAGFSYAPQAGRAALGKAQSFGAMGGAAAAGPAASAGAAQAAGAKDVASAAGKGKNSAGTVAGKGGASSLRDQSSQAPKAAGKETPQGSSQGDAKAGSSGGRAGGGQGAESSAGAESQAAGRSHEQEAQAMKRGSGPFGGPQTMEPTPAHVAKVAARSREMAADSSSGSAVTPAQVNAAAGSLQSRPDLLDSARKAANHHDAEASTGAFAEWSMTDNKDVRPEHKEALGVIGRASPSQRQFALARVGGGSGTSGSDSGGGEGRRVPPTEVRPSSSPSTRMPHAQPGKGDS